jgi:hypothetical protein
MREQIHAILLERVREQNLGGQPSCGDCGFIK